MIYRFYYLYNTFIYKMVCFIRVLMIFLTPFFNININNLCFVPHIQFQIIQYAIYSITFIQFQYNI